MSELTPDQFWSILHAMPLPLPVFYRLYYDDNGNPVIYSMENLPGKYIEVDAETYACRPSNVRVVDGKLKVIQPTVTVYKLYPNADSGVHCHVDDVCVVVSNLSHTTWNKKFNETS